MRWNVVWEKGKTKSSVRTKPQTSYWAKENSTEHSGQKSDIVGQFWPPVHQIPAQTFEGKDETTAVSQNKRKKIETFTEIC